MRNTPLSCTHLVMIARAQYVELSLAGKNSQTALLS